MKRIIKTTCTIAFTIMLLISCGSNQNEESENLTAYEMMENAFEGYPRESEIKPMMEDVMKTHNMRVTEENLQKFGSVLIGLRKESKVGVTEMEILKRMYQKGSNNNTMPDQAAISFYYLETTKQNRTIN